MQFDELRKKQVSWHFYPNFFKIVAQAHSSAESGFSHFLQKSIFSHPDLQTVRAGTFAPFLLKKSAAAPKNHRNFWKFFHDFNPYRSKRMKPLGPTSGTSKKIRISTSLKASNLRLLSSSKWFPRKNPANPIREKNSLSLYNILYKYIFSVWISIKNVFISKNFQKFYEICYFFFEIFEIFEFFEF